MLNSNNPSYLWMDEMHRTGENPHLVKYFGSLLKCYDCQSNSYNGTSG